MDEVLYNSLKEAYLRASEIGETEIAKSIYQIVYDNIDWWERDDDEYNNIMNFNSDFETINVQIMAYDEFTILQIADTIRDRRKWENLCGGCKHLGESKLYIADRVEKIHYCSHPDRQDGFHDPRPYGCNGHCYEK